MRAPIAIVPLLLGLALSGCLGDEGASSKSADQITRIAKAPSLDASAKFVATLPDGSLADPSLLLDVPPLQGVQRFIGHSSYEPTMGIHPKSGAIFMSGLTLSGGLGGLPDAKVLASFNQGATWKDVSPSLPSGVVHNPPYTEDPFVVSDPVTGRIFTVDLQLLYCAWMSFTDDEGKTWTSNPLGCGQPPVLHDHQSVITGKSRTGLSTYQGRVVYYCVNRIGDSSCSASFNGGQTFGPLVPVFLGVDREAGQFCGGLHAHVKTDNAGRVLLPKGQCGIPSVGVSEDDGRTWTTHVISRSTGIMGHEVNMAADAADNLYAFWIGSNGKPYLSMSRDHGTSWSAARDVAPPGVTATDKPAIHASAAGKVAFAYIGTTHPKGYQNGNNASKWAGATWNAYMGLMTDALAERAIVLTTTVNDPADPIGINRCGGTRCDGLYDFIDVEIDPQGRPWAALVDVCFEKCRTDFAKDPKSARHDGNLGFAGTLASGPALIEAGGALPPLPPVPLPVKT